MLIFNNHISSSKCWVPRLPTLADQQRVLYRLSSIEVEHNEAIVLHGYRNDRERQTATERESVKQAVAQQSWFCHPLTSGFGLCASSVPACVLASICIILTEPRQSSGTGRSWVREGMCEVCYKACFCLPVWLWVHCFWLQDCFAA